MILSCSRHLVTTILVIIFIQSTSTYPDQSQAQSISSFQTIPKAELHLHLSGSYPLDFLLSHATPEQEICLRTNLNLVAQRMNYQSIFAVFNVIAQIVNTNEKVEAGTYALCKSFIEDGVTYAEIRTGLKDLGSGFEGYVQAVLNGIKKAQSPNFNAKLLLSLQRNSPIAIAQKTIDLAIKYKNQGVVGLDISGDATQGNIETILPELLRAKTQGLFLAIHMGESPDERDQEMIIETLKPDRIGHGIHLTQKTLTWMLENKIPLEICISSSFFCKMIEKHQDHPGFAYYRMGHPIIIGTDDPLIFQSSLSDELQKLFDLEIFSKEMLEQIARDSFKYAFRSKSPS